MVPSLMRHSVINSQFLTESIPMANNLGYALDKKKLESDVKDRIGEGYVIQQRLQSRSERAINEYKGWNKYNQTLLRMSFDGEDNYYYQRYSPLVASVCSDSFTTCLRCIEHDLEILESIIVEMPLIRERNDVSAIGAAAIGSAVGLLSGIILGTASKNELMNRLRNLNRKYQIFLSSTFNDLVEERQEVINVILDAGHIPISMERFPASSKKQTEYIRKAMNDCDYLVLVLANRYGTIAEDDERKISYTELEFEYALEIGIPILSFVKERPVNSDDIDDNELQMLEDFIKKSRGTFVAS